MESTIFGTVVPEGCAGNNPSSAMGLLPQVDCSGLIAKVLTSRGMQAIFFPVLQTEFGAQEPIHPSQPELPRSGFGRPISNEGKGMTPCQ